MMELISREELLKRMGVETAIKYGNETAEQLYNSYSTLMLYEIADIIEDCPTIESRPKGKWLCEEYYFDEWVDECSVCGEAYTMIDGTATENGYNFCPNCGADMRGEE